MDSLVPYHTARRSESLDQIRLEAIEVINSKSQRASP